MKELSYSPEHKFNKFLERQIELESRFCNIHKKQNGVFLTSNASVINSVLESVPDDESIFSFSYLEPSCGYGVFLVRLIIKAYLIKPNIYNIESFINNNLYFIDIDPEMINTTKANISELFLFLFGTSYSSSFNYFISDFTILDDHTSKALHFLYQKIDYVIGNPPYVTLYGRRDKKKDENQRIYYLKNYSQFPESLKNGKINYVMLFIERGLNFLKEGGILSFIIDVSFFETAYLYCRKYILENYSIKSLTYNIQGFDNVASGQLIIEIINKSPNDQSVVVIDAETGTQKNIKQELWNNPSDEYKFRISLCEESDKIIEKIINKSDPTLDTLYPKKNLRTCVMLLDMEDTFTSLEPSDKVASYPYYRGSSGLKYKYSQLSHQKYFNYDKTLQDKINDRLKVELTLIGIKNKKRLGFGEKIIYDNPKVYIRQSAKELIASYDDQPSSANNSLYVFSLRDDSEESIEFLKYLCGLLNSNIYTFFAQKRRIIRYNKGKQPQIKTSDLYQIYIPQDRILKGRVVALVDKIYEDKINMEIYKNEIDSALYSYYLLTKEEIVTVNNYIKSFI